MVIEFGPRAKEALGDPTGVVGYIGVETVTSDASSRITNESLRNRARFSWEDFIALVERLRGGDDMFETEPAGGETPTPGTEPTPDTGTPPAGGDTGTASE